MLHRRHFLQGAVGVLAATGITSRLRAQPGLSTVTLAEDLILLQGATQNLLATRRGDGLLLIDSGAAGHADAIANALQQTFGRLPINTLINTHWHPEQTGLNEALGSNGTEIIAHENTRLWLSTETIVRWQDRVYPPAPAAAQPQTTFFDTHALDVDGESVNCGYLLQAHTDGDIFVHFPERKVLMAGGALSSDSWPVIDWSTAGWIGGMVKALDTLIAQADADTIIVPATGAPVDRAELELQKTMYTDIMGKLKIMMEKGYGIGDVLREAPTAGYKPQWSGAEQFLGLAFKSFWGHVRQFDVVQQPIMNSTGMSMA